MQLVALKFYSRYIARGFGSDVWPLAAPGYFVFCGVCLCSFIISEC